VPQAISYPDETIEDYGLRKRSFQFGVEGTYGDLRKLINLLELSDSFLTLESVQLSGSGTGNRLRIDLSLSTLFATSGAADEAAGRLAEAGPTGEAAEGGGLEPSDDSGPDGMAEGAAPLGAAGDGSGPEAGR
jgi:hypothetical protein